MLVTEKKKKKKKKEERKKERERVMASTSAAAARGTCMIYLFTIYNYFEYIYTHSLLYM